MKNALLGLISIVMGLSICTNFIIASDESDEYEKAKKVAQTVGLDAAIYLVEDDDSGYSVSGTDASKMQVLEGYRIHFIDYSLCSDSATTMEEVERTVEKGNYYLFPTVLNDKGITFIEIECAKDKEPEFVQTGSKAGPFVQAVNIISKLQKKDSSIEVSLYTNKEGYDAIFVLTTSDGEYCLPAYGTGLDSSYLEVSDYHQLPTAQNMIAAINEEYLKVKAEFDATPCPVGVNCYGGDVEVMPVVTALAPTKTTNYMPYYLIGAMVLVIVGVVVIVSYRKHKKV